MPDSRSDPVFGIQLEMWIYPGTDGENVFKRRKYSKKCADHYDDHRSSYRVMEIIRNDPGYCWLLCAADHTFRIFAAYLFVKQPGIFSDRNFLWNGSHYGSHLYCHGQAMDISLALAGGAAISGAFFGDRCSPVSTSTLLVAEVTHTDMYKNIPKLMKDSIVPFVISCVAYLVMGWLQSASGSAAAGAGELFSREFRMGLIPLIPAAAIFILAICKVEVKKAMAVSIFLAFVICLVYQHRPLTETLYSMVFGYVSEDAQISKMLNGGGIQSMIKVVAVVCLSSCYSGIFEKTGLLLPLQEKIIKAGEKLAPFAVVLPVSVIACAVSCNQSLATLVTEQLCNKLVTDQEKMAMYLEDGTIVIAPLIPWSIAGAVPLASMGAPGTALFAGCYLYALPLWRLITDCFTRGKQKV